MTFKTPLYDDKNIKYKIQIIKRLTCREDHVKMKEILTLF